MLAADLLTLLVPAVTAVAVSVIGGVFLVISSRRHNTGGAEIMDLLVDCSDERRDLRRQLAAALSDPSYRTPLSRDPQE